MPSLNKYKMSKIQKGDYEKIHYWLRKNYGKANKCENKDCLGKSTRFEWALLKKHKYDFKRDNFLMLCKSCHTKYDFTKNTIDKIIYSWTIRKIYKVKCKGCKKVIDSYFNEQLRCKDCRLEQTKQLKRKNYNNYNVKKKEWYMKNRERMLKKFKKRWREITKPTLLSIKKEIESI